MSNIVDSLNNFLEVISTNINNIIVSMKDGYISKIDFLERLAIEDKKNRDFVQGLINTIKTDFVTPKDCIIKESEVKKFVSDVMLQFKDSLEQERKQREEKLYRNITLLVSALNLLFIIITKASGM